MWFDSPFYGVILHDKFRYFLSWFLIVCEVFDFLSLVFVVLVSPLMGFVIPWGYLDYVGGNKVAVEEDLLKRNV